jgi:hypothetical protein
MVRVIYTSSRARHFAIGTPLKTHLDVRLRAPRFGETAFATRVHQLGLPSRSLAFAKLGEAKAGPD